MNDQIMYTLMGFLGGVAHALVWARSWRELKSFEGFRYVALAAIAGFVYYYAHRNWSLPDGVMAFVSGYCATDFIEALAEKIKALVGGGRGER